MSVTEQTNTDLESIADIIRANDSFVLCGHVSPDGDCLGSQLALWHALIGMGKQATCVLVKDEPVDAGLAFMPGVPTMVPAADFKGEADVFIGLDVPNRQRIGEDACVLLDAAKTSITIDHHAYDTPMCEHVYVDPDTAATAMLAWEIVKMLVEKPSTESALCAYVGLLTDTGGFLFQNTDAATFRVAMELLECGVEPAYVGTHVFQSRSMPSLKLEALTIERMQVFCSGAAVISWIKKEDLERLGAAKSDVEPLIDCLRSLCGVRVACMLREQDGCVRGNLRSKDETDVSALARSVGGGGHKAAAGLTLSMTLEESIAFMRTKIEELLAS